MITVAISYCFPPLRYAQSIQVARMLSDQDVRAIVFRGPREASEDPTLFAGIDRDRLEVHEHSLRGFSRWARQVRRFTVREWLRMPDAYRSWAMSCAREVITSSRLSSRDVLLTFGQPMSDHLAGSKIKSATGCNWIAHFSDPWVDNPYWKATAITRRLNRRLEARVLDSADALIFTTEATRNLVLAAHPHIRPSKSWVIPHSLDPDLFVTRDVEAGLVRHVGNFYGDRAAAGLLEGWRLMQTRDPHRTLRLELVGSGVAAAEDGTGVTRRAPVSYVESLRLMSEAHVLVAVEAPAERSIFLPSKVIDYLGARRPIVALSPPGPAADLIAEAGGWVAPPDDVERIAQALTAALSEPSQASWTGNDVRRRFLRSVVARQLKQVVEAVG